jgi:hypothetical protein
VGTYYYEMKYEPMGWFIQSAGSQVIWTEMAGEIFEKIDEDGPYLVGDRVSIRRRTEFGSWDYKIVRRVEVENGQD